MTSSSPQARRPKMTRRQKLTVLLLLGTQFMLSVDFSVFNVALPTIGSDVGISLADVSWISTMFALPAAGFTLLFGRVADLLGRRRIFLAGLGLLAASSVLGGLAGSPTLLLLARLLQGLATAATVPAALALLVVSFEEGPLRRRALGMNGALLSGGFTVGSLLGGVFTTALSWRWAFLFNVPVALAIMLFVPRVVPESRGGDVRRLDAPGAITVTCGLLALVYGVVSAGEAEWASASGWTFVAVGAILLAAFIAIEARSEQPLVPLPVLRRPTVAWGNIGGFAVLAMESGVVFVLTIYLQRALDHSAIEAGLLLGGPGLVSVFAALLVPRTIERTNPAAVLVGGLIIQGLASLGLLAVTGSSPAVALLLAVVLIGFFGHMNGLVASTVTATSGLPDTEQGLATSILTMTQRTAVTVGTPIIGTIATAGATGVADLTSQVHLAIAITGVVPLIAAGTVGMALLRPGRLARPVGT